MADNDYHIIKPVESLKNIAGLTPAQRRKERKRRGNFQEAEKPELEQNIDESVEQAGCKDDSLENQDRQHRIDYRA